MISHFKISILTTNGDKLVNCIHHKQYSTKPNKSQNISNIINENLVKVISQEF